MEAVAEWLRSMDQFIIEPARLPRINACVVELNDRYDDEWLIDAHSVAFTIRSFTTVVTHAFLKPPRASMEANLSKQPKGNDDTLSSLNTAIDDLEFARATAGAKAVRDTFTSTSGLLTTIRVGFLLALPGWSLADVCRTR